MIKISEIGCFPKTIEEAKVQLVIGSRILSNEGLVDSYGHISVRNPENPETFLQSRSLAADIVTLDDILILDFKGNVLEGPEGARPYWENVLHGRIFAARSDVSCVFHGHPLEVHPFTVIPDMPPLPVKNSGGVFYNGYGYYDSPAGSDMTVKTVEEADEVAAALGDKWAVLMRCHGVTAASENIPQMIVDMIAMVQNASVYADCLKMGITPKYCSPEEGLAYRTSHHAEKPLLRTWEYYVRRAKRVIEDIRDM